MPGVFATCRRDQMDAGTAGLLQFSVKNSCKFAVNGV